jgi:hypothetical protein
VAGLVRVDFCVVRLMSRKGDGHDTDEANPRSSCRLPAAAEGSALSGQCAQPNTPRLYHRKMTCPIVTRHDEIGEALSNLERPRRRYAKQNDAAYNW